LLKVLPAESLAIKWIVSVLMWVPSERVWTLVVFSVREYGVFCVERICAIEIEAEKKVAAAIRRRAVVNVNLLRKLAGRCC
jgi:hypothetical protein